MKIVKVLIVLFAGFCLTNAYATETNLFFWQTLYNSDGPYPPPSSSYPPDFCLGQPVYGPTLPGIGQIAVEQNNLRTGPCDGPLICRNQATYVDAVQTSDVTGYIYVQSVCTGSGYSLPASRARAPRQDYSCGTKTTAGNPCDVAAQAKIQYETDYAAVDQFGLSFQRIYNSRAQINTKNAATTMGPGWRSSFDRQITRINIAMPVSQLGTNLSMVQATRSDGQVIPFTYSSTTGNWSPDPDVHWRLEPRADVSGMLAGWTLKSGRDSSYETYDAFGKLVSIVDKNGFALNLAYVDGLLSSVSDAHGRTMTFEYDQWGFLLAMTDPAGRKHAYSYSYVAAIGTSMLYRVTVPNETPTTADDDYREYVYDNMYTQGGQYYPFLIGIVGEDGQRLSTWAYDIQGRPTLSVHGDAASLVDRTQINYPDSESAQVTSSLNAATTFTFVDMFGVRKFGEMSAPCPNCGNTSHKVTYDLNGYPDLETDFNGHVIDHDYNASGQQTKQTDGAGTSEARIMETDWSSALRTPIERRTRNASGTIESITHWIYNTRGQVLATCQIDPTATYTCVATGAPPTGGRRSSYTYCEAGDPCPLIGLMRTATDPLGNITTYDYFATTDETGCGTLGGTCHRQGDLWKVTNALNQVVETVSYDKAGHATRVKDANGTLTDFTYSPRGWLLTRIVRANAVGTPDAANDAKTTFAYDTFGNVTRVTQPDGVYLNYTYDAVHRLTDVVDNLGNRIQYTPDVAGNRTKEETFDATYNPSVPGQGLKRSLVRDYNQLNRLIKVRNAQNQVTRDSTSFNDAVVDDGYDHNGNAVIFKDGLNVETMQEYDSLNRLTDTIQDYFGTAPSTHDATTHYTYDARNNLRSVRDPDLLTTSYDYDGLNNLTALHSPDTGMTFYRYDAAGNRIKQGDARGSVSFFSYDALNRLTAITYSGNAALNVSFSYDGNDTSCDAGVNDFNIGKLSAITDASGTTTYCYDRRGNAVKKEQFTVGANGGYADLPMLYAYTLGDRIASIVYPSGYSISYGYDLAGRTTLVSYKSIRLPGFQGDSYFLEGTLVSDVSYYPFGPANKITFGNARTLTKVYDTDYHIASIYSSEANGLILDFDTDVMGNITAASNSLGASPTTRQYRYDHLYRLVEVDDSSNNPLERFGYNKTGDRTSHTLGTQSPQVYTYLANTHRLDSIASAARTYDANGNTTSTDVVPTLVYDDRNRLVETTSVSSLNPATYNYNGRGERTFKSLGSEDDAGAIAYAYDESGHLLNETTMTPGRIAGDYMPTAEYIYLEGVPVATVHFETGFYDENVGTYYYIESDHLGTPRIVVANSAPHAAPTWKWDFFGSAFGDHAANEDPDGDSGSFVMNLRYPGQHFDVESGLSYNYFRDYDPAIGRYVESDPIGLRGGIDTYRYTSTSPIQKKDPMGLLEIDGSCKDCDGSSAASIRASAATGCNRLIPKITNWARARCVLRRCEEDGVISCNDDYCRKNPKVQGHNDAFSGYETEFTSFRIPKKSIVLCLDNFEFGGPSGLMGAVIVHEFAHSCGWEHGDDEGVPRDPKREQKPPMWWTDY